MKILKVKPSGGFLVPDYEAMDQGVLRYIGRRHDPSIGYDLPKKDPKTGKMINTGEKTGGWVPQEEPVTVPYRVEYLQELRAGALLPADEETARLAGVAMPVKETNQ